MAEYKACPNKEMAIYILDFIRRGYEKKLNEGQGGCQKYIEALQMGIDALNNKPEEVKHATWYLNENGSGMCSNCRVTQKDVWDFDKWQNYCGHCGAKMDGKDINVPSK